MSNRVGIFIATLIILFVAGCASAPIVVHDIQTPVTPVLKPAPESLLVLPLSGLTPRIGIAMGVRTAWALRQAGYPARHVTVSDGVSPVLTGWISETSSSGDISWLDIDWVAYGVNGALLGKYEQKTAVPRSGWDRLSSETLGAVVVEAMSGIDDLIRVEMFPPGSLRPQAILAMPLPELAGPMQQSSDTIIVSSEGIAKVDDTGKENWVPLVSITVETATGESVSEHKLAPVELIDPSMRDIPLDAYISEELTDEYVENIDTDLPDIDDLGSLPQPDPKDEVAMVTVKQGTDISSDEPDDVDALTPQKAALVTTTPEVTMSDTSSSQATPSQATESTTTENPAAQDQNTIQQQQVASVQTSPPVSTAFAPAMYRPVFLVRQASGAPGDGNLALRDAMRKALRNNDAMVSEDLKQASHIVQGTVRVEVPFAGRQRVRIVWMVTNTAGLEMGTALQENDVPEGSLEQPWGSLADRIANAAVLGIAQLFDTGLDAGGAGGQLSQPDLPHLQ